MSNDDAYVGADMETGISVEGASDGLKNEISSGSAANTMLVQGKDVSAVLRFNTEGVSKEGEDYKVHSGEEKYAIEELMNAPNYSDELKRVWVTDEETTNTKMVTDNSRPEIVEPIRSSNDTFEAGSDREAVDIERPDALVATGFPKHLTNSRISYVRVNEGHDTALLIQGIQQSSALISSPLSSLHTPSSSADTWLRNVGLNSSQKLVEGAAKESLHGGYRPDDNFISAEERQIDGIFPGGFAKELLLPTVGSSLNQPRQVLSSNFEMLHSSTFKDCAELKESTGGQAFASLNFGMVGMEDSVNENKAVFCDYHLKRVLSDPLTGLFMDDAMVSQCGHSFGRNSLHRVKETNLCLTCGESIPPGSLIPNYALRAAIQAYKREEQLWPTPSKGSKRRREHTEQPESSEGKKANRALLPGSSENTITDGSRSKGVQFPFVVDDRVLIKGNKRTPERFVGREAIITTQCLNGWYLVRTLDNGESVRLQYRSLQKMGDKEAPAHSGDTVCGAEGSRGHSSTSVPTSISDDRKEVGSPSHISDRMTISSSPSAISKGLRSDFLSRIKWGSQSGTAMQAASLSDATLLSGGTSSNSSQEQQAEQSEDKVLEQFIIEEKRKIASEARNMNASAQEGLKTIHTVAGVETGDDDIEGSSLQAGCKVWHEEEDCMMDDGSSRKVKTIIAGVQPTDGGTFASNNELDDFVIMPKLDDIQTRRTIVAENRDCPALDKKVYSSGSWRHENWDENASMSIKQSASALLDTSTGYPSRSHLQVVGQEAEEKTICESSCLQSVADTCETVREGMRNLECEIPWSCMQDVWKRCRSDWLRRLQDSKTAKDLGNRLQELRGALLLTKAGNLIDEEWNKELKSALESEEMKAIASLWERVQEDVSKWMESKPKRNRRPLSIKSEIINLGDLQKLFPQLCVGGLSRAGISAATSVAAAEAFADGQQDTEALLAVPMKLIREHSKQDLLAVREAIVREKRHIAAKLVHLESLLTANEDSKDEAAEVGLLIENPKQRPTSPAFISIEGPFTTAFSNDLSILTSERCFNYTAGSPSKGGEQLKGLPVQETDGEATDLSDSD